MALQIQLCIQQVPDRLFGASPLSESELPAPASYILHTHEPLAFILRLALPAIPSTQSSVSDRYECPQTLLA